MHIMNERLDQNIEIADQNIEMDDQNKISKWNVLECSR